MSVFFALISQPTRALYKVDSCHAIRAAELGASLELEQSTLGLLIPRALYEWKDDRLIFIIDKAVFFMRNGQWFEKLSKTCPAADI